MAMSVFWLFLLLVIAVIAATFFIDFVKVNASSIPSPVV